ncbi:MAG TPA: amino acid adenylation domain-containing protein [Glycomyces sp.]|nr:amino acid adenylation domain-containing protein [Glycomyces sp.]
MAQMRDRLKRLPLERRTRFLSLLRSGQGHRAPDRPGPRPERGTAPLSSAQRLLWFFERSFPGLITYNLMFCFRMRGELNVTALQAAVNRLVARHEPLRTSLPEREDGPVQRIAAPGPYRLPLLQASGSHRRARREHCQKLAEELANQPFDVEQSLWRAALTRVDDDEHLFVFIVHHVVFDGISAEVFMRDLAELYRAEVERTEPKLPELPIQHADYAHWERQRMTDSRRRELVDYWRTRLADPPRLNLPTDRPRPAKLSYRGSTHTVPLPEGAAAEVKRLANRLGVTPYPVYLAAFAVLLQRYCGQEDLIVGCSTAQRDKPELENILGFLVNMLAFRVDTGGDPDFAELVRRVDATRKDAFSHAELPFDEVVKAVAPARDTSRLPLVQVAFSVGGVPRLPEFPGVDLTYEQLPISTSKFDMTWQVSEGADGSTVGMEYATDLFDRATVEAMLNQYGHLLTSLLADPLRPVGDAELTTEAERAELVALASGPVRPERDITVDVWFAEQAAAAPEAVAVVAGDRRLTYRELDRAANRLAWLLREHGAGCEQRVAIKLARGADHVVAALATLKAGAGFIPIDPEHPRERIAELIADAAPCAVVTDDPGPLPSGVPAVVLPQAADRLEDQPDHAPPRVTGPHNLAYVIYTSGSTGRPKGVLVEHRNVVSFTESMRRLFDLGSDDRILAYASYTFDVSIFEMFGALLSGAQLHVAADADRLDIDRLQSLMEASAITVSDLPPSVMALLTPERLPDHRIAFCGGEAYPGELVNRWNRGRRFFNGYGPSECTVTMITHECRGRWDSSPPIGVPIANHVAHVLDDRLRPLPPGVPGELVIGGTGLARGYLNRHRLTRERFCRDPFGTTPDHRLYRTGDLVKRLPGGELLFLGRIDRQLKVNGVRIEPGEIESVLSEHPAVLQALVEAWTDPRDHRSLVAYVALDPDRPTASVDELQEHLRSRLPSALVPNHVVVLDSMPLNASGKVDRSALPAPQTPLGAAPEDDEPRSETERIVNAELFAPMFGTDLVPRNANFFELGGGSLQAAQLISSIRRRFDVEVGVADFFTDATVVGLTAVVERRRAQALSEDDLLEMLENLPDDIAERMLDGQTRDKEVAGGLQPDRE